MDFSSISITNIPCNCKRVLAVSMGKVTVSATQLAIPPKKKGFRSGRSDPVEVGGSGLSTPTPPTCPARGSAPVEDVEVMA